MLYLTYSDDGKKAIIEVFEAAFDTKIEGEKLDDGDFEICAGDRLGYLGDESYLARLNWNTYGIIDLEANDCYWGGNSLVTSPSPRTFKISEFVTCVKEWKKL